RGFRRTQWSAAHPQIRDARRPSTHPRFRDAGRAGSLASSTTGHRLMGAQRLIWPALVLATILFYSFFLFAPSVTIHWDLADVAYPAQKYFADSIHAGHLPHWTPFLFSGMP